MVRRFLAPAIVLVLVIAIFQLVATPEPAALVLLGAAFAAIAAVTRRMSQKVRRQSSAPVETSSRD